MRALNILVVDDDEDFADALTELLQTEGHETTVALSAEEALTRIAERAFALALVDIKLSDTSGLAVLRAIRDARSQTDVVMMTGDSAAMYAEAAEELGARTTLQKPFETERLLLEFEAVTGRTG